MQLLITVKVRRRREKHLIILDKQILEDYKIIDSVGAGDCFTSAFCSKFLKSLSGSNLESMKGKG